jgi:hypothetical protein
VVFTGGEMFLFFTEKRFWIWCACLTQKRILKGGQKMLRLFEQLLVSQEEFFSMELTSWIAWGSPKLKMTSRCELSRTIKSVDTLQSSEPWIFFCVIYASACCYTVGLPSHSFKNIQTTGNSRYTRFHFPRLRLSPFYFRVVWRSINRPVLSAS